MVKRTLGQIRSKLGRVASLNGFRSTDTRLVERINDAVEDIMEAEDFPFIVDFYKFTVTNGLVVMPNNIDRIMGATVDDKPIHYRSPWYEFIDTAVGKLDEENRDFVMLERNETVLFTEFPTADAPYVLRIIAEGDETANGVFHVRGLDENGDKIFTGGVEGLDISYTAGSPYTTTTTQRFSKITSIVKSTTTGNIKLYALPEPSLVLEETEIIYSSAHVPSGQLSTIHVVALENRITFNQPMPAEYLALNAGDTVRLANTLSNDGDYTVVSATLSTIVVQETVVFEGVPPPAGYIAIMALPAESPATQIGCYEPKDTTPSYRQYFIPALESEGTNVLDIRGKRRFIPVSDDNDVMPISNHLALKYMLISHHKADSQDEVGAQTNYSLAMEKMWKASRSYRGKTKSPAMVSETGTGSGDFDSIV